MRRMVFAGLLLALSATASAQGSVTLYGILDSGLLYQNKTAPDGHSGVAFLDGAWLPSIYGLRGKEDIGGGYSVNFNLQGGFSTGTGALGDSNGGIFGRAATVGVSGPFGDVKLGVQFSPFFLAVTDGDPRGMPQFGSQLVQYFQQFGITGIFDSNAIVYTSPKLYGFTGALEYAVGGVPGATKNGRSMSASLSFSQGPVLANAAYYTHADPQTGETVAIGKTAALGYAFGPVLAKVDWVNYLNPSSSAPLSNVNVFGVGAVFAVTPAITLNGGFYYAVNKGMSENKSRMFAFGAEYALSHRTTLYSQIGVAHNQGAFQTNLAVLAPSSFAVPQGTTTTAVNIGIRHTF
ncbi:porin [Paraburkholderia sp. Ac-20347]|uniref:porin n=1 Tax=Paraburkholderia sp. Ac-20347 TaxID=2703892 RepID=UPI001F126A26|nr:porin [Paraburkholderia sp. Ac-20347]